MAKALRGYGSDRQKDSEAQVSPALPQTPIGIAAKGTDEAQLRALYAALGSDSAQGAALHGGLASAPAGVELVEVAPGRRMLRQGNTVEIQEIETTAAHTHASHIESASTDQEGSHEE